MNIGKKLGMGFLAFYPIVGIILYVILFFGIFVTATSNPGNPDFFLANFGFLMFLICSVGLVSLIGMIVYIIDAMKNPNLNKENNEHLIWLLVIMLTQGIGMIVYYFMIVLKNPEPKNDLMTS